MLMQDQSLFKLNLLSITKNLLDRIFKRIGMKILNSMIKIFSARIKMTKY